MSGSRQDWNDRYLKHDTPWAKQNLLTPVVDTIQQTLPKGSSLIEIGCGYAREAIALARLGYQVTALDVSATAIAQAKQNADAAGVAIPFHVGNFLKEDMALSLSDALLDIAVLHTFKTDRERQQFAAKTAALLKPGGLWFSVSCVSPDVTQKEKETGVKAPPALSHDELLSACSPWFELIDSRAMTFCIFREGRSADFPTRVAVMKKRA
jgi:SAM-dependent methyltransferase